jgi:adenylyltransferase/sulfurtransferase
MSADPDFARYHRQVLLPGIGVEGQRALQQARVVLIGCGALGTIIADLLVRAGVGHLCMVDRDVVELTNLQRQTLFDEEDARRGKPKAVAAASRLARINSDVTLAPIVGDLNSRTLSSMLSEGAADVLVDATDNFATRYLLNDAAVSRGIPLVYGGALGTTGAQCTIIPWRTACLRCLCEIPPAPGETATCDTAGVFGPVTALIGAMQAAEVIKVVVD